jgi:lysyl-tRNA synthetase class 2
MREEIKNWNIFISKVKHYLGEHECIEVSTSILNKFEVPNEHIKPFKVISKIPPHKLFLHTSPELKMKELLSLGSRDIYQICTTFRDEEVGSWHTKEFQMLEWYRVGIHIDKMIKEVNGLLLLLLDRPSDDPIKKTKIAYKDLFYSLVHEDYPSTKTNLIECLKKHDINFDGNLLTHNDLLDLLFSSVMQLNFSPHELVTITQFPSDQASMASVDPTDNSISTRFECFYRGIELANGYEELRQVDLLAQRFKNISKKEGSEYLEIPKDYLTKVSTLLPQCCGVSIGLNRLYALSRGATSIPSDRIYC